MGHGVYYNVDGEGPLDIPTGSTTFFPDAGCHYIVTEIGAGPVRYIRWQINKVWRPTATYLQITEMWYWGGIVAAKTEE
jgi:hypothetical protein